MGNDIADQVNGTTQGVDLRKVEHCKVGDAFAKFEADEETTAAVNAYLSSFAVPQGGRGSSTIVAAGPTCIQCGKVQGGFIGAFRWGLVHGEGTCSCGWPARVHHCLTLEGFDEPLRFHRLLQYHPSVVEPRVWADLEEEAS